MQVSDWSQNAALGKPFFLKGKSSMDTSSTTLSDFRDRTCSLTFLLNCVDKALRSLATKSPVFTLAGAHQEQSSLGDNFSTINSTISAHCQPQLQQNWKKSLGLGLPASGFIFPTCECLAVSSFLPHPGLAARQHLSQLGSFEPVQRRGSPQL